MIHCSFNFLQGIVKFDRVGDRENTIEILQQQGVLFITFPKSLLIQNCSQILKVKVMFKELSHIPTFHFQVIPGQWSDCVTNLPPCWMTLCSFGKVISTISQIQQSLLLALKLNYTSLYQLKIEPNDFRLYDKINPGLLWFYWALHRGKCRKLASSSQPIKCKTKTNNASTTRVFPRFSHLTCFTFNSHWLLKTVTFLLICRGHYFGLGFLKVNLFTL